MSLFIVTGGIGCGKTTILKDFAACGAQVDDADDITHRLYVPGSPFVRKLSECFGEGVIASDGGVDRRALGKIVFQNPGALRALNGLVHPAVFEAISQRAEAAGDQPLMVAVPLWYECRGSFSHHLDVQAVIATWCGPQTQKERLRMRGWSDEEIARRLNSQLSADEKAARADRVIMTDCSWEQLNDQCRRIYIHLTNT